MTFRPSLISTVVLALLALLFARLATWQWDRSEFKQSLLDGFDAAPSLSALPVSPSASDFSRVQLSGRWESERDFLLDNQVQAGRPGVHVISPFRTHDGQLLLVNRGWLPMPPDRRSLPAVTRPDDEQRLSGHLASLRTPGKRLGDESVDPDAPWPRLVTWPDIGEMANALDEPVFALVLHLDADSPGGFAGRDWSPVVMGPGKHRAYAFQWSALCLTALIAWVVLALNRKTT